MLKSNTVQEQKLIGKVQYLFSSKTIFISSKYTIVKVNKYLY